MNHFVGRMLAVMACFLSWSGLAWPQDYPAKPVRLILPFPAGGGSDLIARVVAQKLTAALGQSVLVDNRAGASGNIAAELVAKSPPDGYTLLFGNSSLSISPAVFHREVAKAVHLPDVKQRFDAEGATPVGSTPGEFAAFFRSEAEKWAEVAKRSGTKLD